MSSTSTREDLDQLVRSLSHDMSANFMLLESSFSQLKKSLAGMLPVEEPQDEITGRVAHVEACLRQSKQFLDDLDWLARTGGVEMEPTQVDLSAVVAEVLFEQRELLAQGNVEVDVRRPLPAVWCNGGRLKQIVTNLVRNAVHHGCDPQRPRITIAPCQSKSPAGASANEDENGATVAFRIHDNGPGIEPRFHRKIFRPGRRLSPTGAQGSGMGLAIVKRIVDHYGGSAYVDPHSRMGTTIVVTLPNAARQVAEDLAAETGSSEEATRRWKLELDGEHRRRPRPPRGKFAHTQQHRPQD